jgi:hypothetical protein
MTDRTEFKEAKAIVEAEECNGVMMQPAPPIAELQSCLVDESAAIAKRIRSVFWLKHINTNEAVSTLASGEREQQGKEKRKSKKERAREISYSALSYAQASASLRYFLRTKLLTFWVKCSV